MRWLKPALWISAWGVWVWLGVGLHRELPRQFGPPLRYLPLDIKWFRGFLGGTNRAFFLEPVANGSRISVYDVETGEHVFTVPGPNVNGELDDFNKHSAWPIVLAKYSFDRPGSGWATEGAGRYTLDLKTGQWRRIAPTHFVQGALHDRRPWILIFKGGAEADEPQPLLLLDWQSGRQTTICEVPASRTVVGRMFFLDGERAVIQVRERDEISEKGSGVWEVWRIKDPPTLERRLTDLPSGVTPSVSPSGRIAFADPQGSSAVEVYDLNEGRYLFRNFNVAERPPQPWSIYSAVGPPYLSPKGRAVFGGAPPALHEIAGRTLWGPEYNAGMAQEGDNRFTVGERWDLLWCRWLPNLKYYTIAIRDMETGRLFLRQAPGTQMDHRSINAAGTLALGADGAVYRLPLSCNWRLLAFCEIVLALPIVLTWFLLHRRRYRIRSTASQSLP